MEYTGSVATIWRGKHVVKHGVIVAGNTSEFQEFYLGQSKVQLFLSPCKQKGLLSLFPPSWFFDRFRTKKVQGWKYCIHFVNNYQNNQIWRNGIVIYKREEIGMGRERWEVQGCSFNVNRRRAICNKLKYDLRRIDSIDISFERFLNIRLLVIDRSHSCVANISPRGICIARGQMLASHEILSGIRSQNKYNSESNQSITLIAYYVRIYFFQFLHYHFHDPWKIGSMYGVQMWMQYSVDNVNLILNK